MTDSPTYLSIAWTVKLPFGQGDTVPRPRVKHFRHVSAPGRKVAGNKRLPRQVSDKGQSATSSSWKMFGSFQDIAAILAFIAIVAYGVAYYFQYSFYHEFGLTPDQVGVDRLSALLRMAPLAVTVVCAVMIGGLALLRTGLDLIAILTALWRIGRRRRPVVGLGLSVLLIGLAWWTMQNATPYTLPVYLVTLIVAAILFFLMAMLTDWEKWPWLNRRHVAAGIVLVAAAAVSASFGSWIKDGARDLSVTGNYARRFGAIGIPVDYASVRWIDPQKKPSSVESRESTDPSKPPSLLVIINQSSAIYAFYDCRTGQSHVIQAADVVVERVREPRGVDRKQWLSQGTRCAERR